MRDHYYQLFDLEKNFGEKMYCDKNKQLSNGPYQKGMSEHLSDWLGVARGNHQGNTNRIQPTDPFGYSLGAEATPQAIWINDCCVLNSDEKPDEKLTRAGVRSDYNPCASVRFRKNGVEMGAGRCIFKQNWGNKMGKILRWNQTF